MFCPVCASTMAAGSACAVCAKKSRAIVSVSGYTTGPSATTLLPPVPSPPAQRQTPAQMRYVGGGSVCPSCFSGPYANTYSVWHVLLTIVAFPIGAVAFFAPIKKCYCGHKYGAGVTLVRASKVLLAIAIVFMIAVIMVVANLASKNHVPHGINT